MQSSKRQRVLVRETPSAGSAGGRSHTRSIEDLRWHYPMLNDHERNAKFCAAVESAVRAAQRALRSRGVDRGVRVLDIGAGSGLLALAAARAGAEHVTACEADPLVAAAASEVIQANGLAHCVTLVPLHSSQLSVEDLRESQPADIVTHELLDSTLLGEDVLPALRDTYARGLVRPDAQSVPWGARIEAQLVESTALWSRRHPPASLWSDNESSPSTVAAAEGGGQQLAAAGSSCSRLPGWPCGAERRGLSLDRSSQAVSLRRPCCTHHPRPRRAAGHRATVPVRSQRRGLPQPRVCLSAPSHCVGARSRCRLLVALAPAAARRG